MRNVTLFSCCIMLAFAFGCKAKKQKPSGEIAGQTNKTEMEKLIIEPDVQVPGNVLSYEIQRAWITKDTLVVQVVYSGGCKEHSFSLVSNGAFMKSVPPKLNVVMFHTGETDECRQVIEQTLKFDIKSGRYPGDKYGKVMIRLDGWPDELEYTYPEGK